MRDRSDIEQTMSEHADTVVHVCMLYLSDHADRDDAFQETFIKYAQSDTVFNDAEHRKAWLIRVATNTCKDMLKQAARRNVALDDVGEGALEASAQDDGLQRRIQATELAGALRKLDEKYRVCLYLKYYHGYTAADIATMLDMPENTVYTNLSRGKEHLKEVLGSEQ